MSLHVKTAIKNVALGISDPIPAQVLSYCERLYGQTLHKRLPKSYESARYHICAFLSVEKYSSTFNLPSPDFKRIPIPPKKCLTTLEDFRLYLDSVKSALSTPTKQSPHSSPLANLPIPQSPFQETSSAMGYTSVQLNGSPVKLSPSQSVPRGRKRGSLHETSTPTRSSPLKKLRAIANETPSAEQSPSIVRSIASPFLTPNSKAVKPFKVTEDSVSIVQLIQLCNTFYMPASVTVSIIQEFINQRHKFVKKSDWYLACGLIYAASLRINHRIIKDKPDYGETLVTQFIRQRSKLKKPNLIYWNTLINEGVKNQPWIIEIENTFMFGVQSSQAEKKENDYRLGIGAETYDRLGMMNNSHSNILSDSQQSYYNTWSSNVLSQI
ncbi:hypothetical protein CANTEDRAFT_116694, partial [Yamadazyma tenuis ATCC 10573]